MVTIEVNNDIRIGSYGVGKINGHVVTLGTSPDGYEIVCAGCDTSYEFGENFFELDSERSQMAQYYSMHLFLQQSCESDAETLSEAMSDRVMNDYIGHMANDSTKVSIENEVSKILAGSMEVTVDMS
jgi:hypothetical protein